MNVWTRFKSSGLGIVGLAILVALAIFILICPLISSYRYDEIHLNLKNLPPSSQFWFGTDDLGRDIFTRISYGARISLFVGISAAFIDLWIGMVWGGVAGFSGGKLDECMMRTADILYSIPYLLKVTLLMIVLGSGLLSMIVALALIGWITMARIVRGQILLLKEMDYVLAARVLGASYSRILFKHLLPNAYGPIFVTLTLTVPAAIFSEAFLSFLGLGVQAPLASWGTMASEGLPAMQYYPWRLLFPAGFISITMLAFYMIGEGLKVAFNKSEQLDPV